MKNRLWLSPYCSHYERNVTINPSVIARRSLRRRGNPYMRDRSILLWIATIFTSLRSRNDGRVMIIHTTDTRTESYYRLSRGVYPTQSRARNNNQIKNTKQLLRVFCLFERAIIYLLLFVGDFLVLLVSWLFRCYVVLRWFLRCVLSTYRGTMDLG